MSATGMGSSAPRSVIESCVVSAATAWGFYLMARFVNHRQGSVGAWSTGTSHWGGSHSGIFHLLAYLVNNVGGMCCGWRRKPNGCRCGAGSPWGGIPWAGCGATHIQMSKLLLPPAAPPPHHPLFPLQALLEHERHERKAERQGRIRAEMDLKRLQYQAVVAGAAATSPALQRLQYSSAAAAGMATTAEQLPGPHDDSGEAQRLLAGTENGAPQPPPQGALSYPFRPIGTIQSCFSQR